MRWRGVNQELLDRTEGTWHDKALEGGGSTPQAAGSSIPTLSNESDVRFFFDASEGVDHKHAEG